MRRTLALVVVLTAVAISPACKSRKTAVEAAYSSWNAAVEKAQSTNEKVAATRSFLERFPDTEHTEDAASTLAYLLGDELGKPAEADAYLVELTGKVHDPEQRRAVMGLRLEVLGKLKDGVRLRQAVDEFTAGRDLKFADRSMVAGAALECGEWALALTTAEAALPLATPEAVKSDNPDRKLSEQRIADSARRRKVEMLDTKGWALANLGRHDEAVAVLRDAHLADFHGYMGNTESPAGSYLGRTLLMAGKHDEATDLLAVAALYGGDEPALKALRGMFAAAHGSDSGFDDYLAATRLRLARTIDDFTLPDYAAKPYTFSKLRNGEVTLLSFWFPT
jgi:hypothetical protein